MDTASLDCIRQLLEITERERKYKLISSVKNLRELGASPFRYIVPIIPYSLPKELVKGEHFVLVDLLTSIPGGSLQAGSAPEPQAEIAHNTSATFVQLDQSPLDEHYSRPAPEAVKKKKKGKVKAVGEELEGFVDWVDLIASDPIEKREDDMFSLAIGFAPQMRKHKLAASAQGETVPCLKYLGEKAQSDLA